MSKVIVMAVMDTRNISETYDVQQRLFRKLGTAMAEEEGAILYTVINDVAERVLNVADLGPNLFTEKDEADAPIDEKSSSLPNVQVGESIEAYGRTFTLASVNIDLDRPAQIQFISPEEQLDGDQQPFYRLPPYGGPRRPRRWQA